MSDTDEYPRSPVRGDPHEQARLQLKALAEDGLASGQATPMTEADWADLAAIADGKPA